MSVIWIIGCLLNQYIISYLFKKYDRAQTILVIINPIISIIVGIGIMIILLSESLVIMKDIDKVEDEKEKQNLIDIRKKNSRINCCINDFCSRAYYTYL